MSRLADLIAQLCPDGVEYKPLSECVVLPSIPRGLKRGQYESSGTYPIVDQGRGQVAGYSSDETKLVKDIPGIVFGDHTREIKYVDHFFVPGADGVKWIRAVDDVDIRYLFHSLSSLAIPSRGYNRHWNVVREMSIPVPPLEVQREIVRILDQFTTLEAELEAELEARQAQYEYYREQLLSYDSIVARCSDEVKYRSLGDLIRIRNGRDYKMLSSGTVPVYGSGGVMTHVSEAIGVGPTVLIPRKGSLDNIFFVEGPFWTVDTIFYTEIGSEIEPKYLYYNLKKMRLSQMNEAAGVPSMNQRKLNRIQIPLPSIEEQRRIADVLDRFDALVNDISSGLPAEIAARRAQYEYYRDRLLSFPEKK